jgi:hypothetical protein
MSLNRLFDVDALPPYGPAASSAAVKLEPRAAPPPPLAIDSVVSAAGRAAYLNGTAAAFRYGVATRLRREAGEQARHLPLDAGVACSHRPDR